MKKSLDKFTEQVRADGKLETLHNMNTPSPSTNGTGDVLGVKISGVKNIPDYIGVWDQAIVKLLPNFVYFPLR